MDPWKCGYKSGIALVGDNAYGSRVGNGKIGTCDTHISRKKLFPELFSCHLHEPFNFTILVFPCNIGKQICHLKP